MAENDRKAGNKTEPVPESFLCLSPLSEAARKKLESRWRESRGLPKKEEATPRPRRKFPFYVFAVFGVFLVIGFFAGRSSGNSSASVRSLSQQGASYAQNSRLSGDSASEVAEGVSQAMNEAAAGVSQAASEAAAGVSQAAGEAAAGLSQAADEAESAAESAVKAALRAAAEKVTKAASETSTKAATEATAENASATTNNTEGNAGENNQAKEGDLQAVLDRGALYVAIEADTDYPPFYTNQGYDNWLGIDIALIVSFCQYIGVEPYLVPTAWDNILSELETGNVDCVISGMSVTEERQRIVDFSIPYYQERMILYTTESSFIIDEMELEGMTIGACTSDLQWIEDHFDSEEGGDFTLMTFSYASQVEEAVRSGVIDGGFFFSSNLPSSDSLMRTPVQWDAGESVAAAFRKGSDLKEAMDDFLNNAYGSMLGIMDVPLIISTSEGLRN